jgi:hypothetical protein
MILRFPRRGYGFAVVRLPLGPPSPLGQARDGKQQQGGARMKRTAFHTFRLPRIRFTAQPPAAAWSAW